MFKVIKCLDCGENMVYERDDKMEGYGFYKYDCKKCDKYVFFLEEEVVKLGKEDVK